MYKFLERGNGRKRGVGGGEILVGATICHMWNEIRRVSCVVKKKKGEKETKVGFLF